MMLKLPIWKARGPIAAAEIVTINDWLEGGLELHFKVGGIRRVNAVYVHVYNPVVGGYYVEFVDGLQGYVAAPLFQSLFMPLMAVRGKPPKKRKRLTAGK